MTDCMLKYFNDKFAVSKKDIGEYAKIDRNGMHFKIDCYDVKDAGSLMIMNMSAMLGLMKMTSAVFTSTDIDAPLFSADFVSAAGNNTLLLELYDTCLSPWDASPLEQLKKSAADIPDHDPGVHWYDDIRLPASSFKKCRKNYDALSRYANDYICEYVRLLDDTPKCGRDEKLAKNSEYTEGLISNGGPAVDQFVKMLGKEKTAEFLKKYMFVCE